MDMLRWPRIERLLDDATGAARFVIVMESNGVDPTQRVPGRRPEGWYEGKTHAAGTIYRADVRIPKEKRNDPEFIASMLTRAWAAIWKDTVAKRGWNEGEDFKETLLDAVDIEITPIWKSTGDPGYDAGLDMRGLVLRPGRFIPVDGNPAKLSPADLDRAYKAVTGDDPPKEKS